MRMTSIKMTTNIIVIIEVSIIAINYDNKYDDLYHNHSKTIISEN